LEEQRAVKSDSIPQARLINCRPKDLQGVFAGRLFHGRSNVVRDPDSGYAVGAGSEKSGGRLMISDRNNLQAINVSWTLERKAVSLEEPSRQVQALS
jgi:hypothetical protein